MLARLPTRLSLPVGLSGCRSLHRMGGCLDCHLDLTQNIVSPFNAPQHTAIPVLQAPTMCVVSQATKCTRCSADKTACLQCQIGWTPLGIGCTPVRRTCLPLSLQACWGWPVEHRTTQLGWTGRHSSPLIPERSSPCMHPALPAPCLPPCLLLATLHSPWGPCFVFPPSPPLCTSDCLLADSVHSIFCDALHAVQRRPNAVHYL